MTDFPKDHPVISPRALSDALLALGAYAEPPTDTDLIDAERAEGRPALTARLANALYGVALAHVMTAEVAAGGNAPRGQAWQAAGADSKGIAAMLHYTAMRLAADLRHLSDNLPVDLGTMAAAADAANALTLLLEICTVRSLDDPRTAHLTDNLMTAADRLATAAGRIDAIIAAGQDVANFITPRPTGPAGVL